ncbi:MAG: hypothetical protein RBS36_04210 [Thiomicrospira sp.]|jgi:hypothetical protein|nr:hypothetical protein [Thiomicrospira sp.]
MEMCDEDKRGAPQGNQNATKDDPATSRIQLRVTPDTKARWVKSAQASELKKLTPWIVNQLNKAAEKDSTKSAEGLVYKTLCVIDLIKTYPKTKQELSEITGECQRQIIRRLNAAKEFGAEIECIKDEAQQGQTGGTPCYYKVTNYAQIKPAFETWLAIEKARFDGEKPLLAR